jgi:RNA polymerase sigma factor (sigma-70 family)
MAASNHEVRNAILRAQTGDSQALSLIIDHFGYIVEAACARIDIEDAAELSRSDLKQEVWLRVWSKIQSFECCNDADRVAPIFGSWLKTTARNVVLTVMERQRAKKRGFGQNYASINPQDIALEGNKTASGILATEEELLRLKAALDGLPAIDARIISMKFRESKTLHEIAAMTSLTFEQVRYRLVKAITKLEQSLR